MVKDIPFSRQGTRSPPQQSLFYSSPSSFFFFPIVMFVHCTTLLLVGLVVGVYSSSSSNYYTIYNNGGHYEVKNVNDPTGGVATAFYNHSINSTVCQLLLIVIIAVLTLFEGLGLPKYQNKQRC